MTDLYESPLSGRYASGRMLALFSAKTRIVTWRKLWTELARVQYELGLPMDALDPESCAKRVAKALKN